MTKKSKAILSLSPDCKVLLEQLGERICLARKRRGMTIAELAARMMVSPKTIQRMEKGDTGISLGVLITALACLGLENDLERIAAPETDAIALAHDKRRLLQKKNSVPTIEEKFFQGQ